MGSLYETVGHLQGVASDTQATFETSLTSGQFGQEREVNILRVGRMVLAYQTTDQDETGIWNKETKSWESLPGRYQRPVRDGISMAKKLKTVGMLELPVPAAEVIQ